MRFASLLIALLMGAASGIPAQEGIGDTTVYQVVEEMPRFPGCEQLDTTLAAKTQCAQQNLLSFIYQNVRYPEEARLNGNEGTVVVSFIVEKDGLISTPQIVRNVDGGCGEEALRVVNLMVENDIKWVPGKQDGKVVRTRFTVPVKFKLEEMPPFVMVGRDSVFTQFDTPLDFEGGAEALSAHLDDKLDYPEVGNDSCMIGTIDVQILIRKNGDVRILNMTDYNDLGFDFWYEAVDAATSTIGKWKIATYEGRKVSSSYDLTMAFFPTAEGCNTTNENYRKAFQLATEAQQMTEDDQFEAKIEKYNQALAMFPNDAQLLFARGQAYLDNNNFEAACEDISKAQRISLLRAYDNILPLICR